MPRANRYFIPGQIWHLTHRCHKREFLLLQEGTRAYGGLLGPEKRAVKIKREGK